MNVIKELKAVAGDFAEVNIIPCSEYSKEWNNKSKDVKNLYKVKIVHKDTRVGSDFVNNDTITLASIMPSKYMDFFYKELKHIFTGTKLYIVSSQECGNELQYDVMWNRNRAV